MDHGVRLGAEAGAFAVGAEAAVHEQGLAGDPRGALGIEQKGSGFGDVGRDAETPDRAGIDLDPLGLGVLELALVRRRAHGPGRDRIDAYPERAELERHPLDEPDEPRFRGAVVRAALPGEVGGVRGDADDRAALAGSHPFRDQPADVEGALEIDVEDSMPALRRQLEEGDRLPDPGDRGERLDRALVGLHGLDGDGDLLPGPHVGPVGGDRASGPFDLGHNVVTGQDVERGDRVAVACEAPGDLGAHPLPRSGDECYSARHEASAQPTRAIVPPSATRLVPVTKEASSDARNRTQFAISRGVPRRFSGAVAA